MICEEAQKLNVVFIEKKLEYKKLNEYVNHLHTCSECRDELEIVYIVNKGLDGDGEDNFNFSGLLSRNLEEARLYIKLCKKRRHISLFLGSMAYITVIAAIISLFLNL